MKLRSQSKDNITQKKANKATDHFFLEQQIPKTCSITTQELSLNKDLSSPPKLNGTQKTEI